MSKRTYLVKIALSLHQVLNGAGLGQVGVTTFAHPFDGILPLVDVHLGVAFHGVEHSLIRGVVGILEKLIRRPTLPAAILN